MQCVNCPRTKLELILVLSPCPLSNAINYAISSVYIHQIYSTHPCQFLLNHISSVSQRPCPSTAIFEVSSRPNWLQPVKAASLYFCRLLLLLLIIIITENGCYIRVKTTGPIRMKLYSDVDLGPLQC